MKLQSTIISAAIVIVSLASSVKAECQLGFCSIHFPKSYVDKYVDEPVKVGADCSFSGAEADVASTFKGGAVADLGNGLIGQRLTESGACIASETLVIADCNVVQSINVEGVCEPNWPGTTHIMSGYSVDKLKPIHSLFHNASPTFSNVVKVTRKNGFEHELLSKTHVGEKRINGVNLYCGCKLFYPDSAGAKL